MEPNPLSAALERLSAGGSLSASECQAAMGQVLDGEAPEAAVGAFLTALHLKGESSDELLGAVRAIRERMISFDPGPEAGPCLDTCGTGGDGADTVNVSTATAIVVAACGVRVVKHGNRAASGRSGSSDVLEQLGVAFDCGAPPCSAAASMSSASRSCSRPGSIRGSRELPPSGGSSRSGRSSTWSGRSATRPLPPTSSSGSRARTTPGGWPRCWRRSESIRRALVVTGSDGLDEVTLDGPTQVRVVESGRIREESWSPEDFGLRRVAAGELRVSGAEESAGMLRSLFAGDRGPVREVVLANAAASLWTVAPVPLREAVDRAARGDRFGGRGAARRAVGEAVPG